VGGLSQIESVLPAHLRGWP